MTEDIFRSYTNEALISKILKFIQFIKEKAKKKIQAILLKTGLARKCKYTFFPKVDSYIDGQRTHERMLNIT